MPFGVFKKIIGAPLKVASKLLPGQTVKKAIGGGGSSGGSGGSFSKYGVWAGDDAPRSGVLPSRRSLPGYTMGYGGGPPPMYGYGRGPPGYGGFGYGGGASEASGAATGATGASEASGEATGATGASEASGEATGATGAATCRSARSGRRLGGRRSVRRRSSSRLLSKGSTSSRSRRSGRTVRPERSEWTWCVSASRTGASRR